MTDNQRGITTVTGRGSWSSRTGFVLAAIGSAIGLGNVWRFPYITGIYGGGAFVIVYIGCVLAVGVPIMLAEFLIGRKTQRNAVGAFRFLRPGSPWALTGWLGIVSGFVILSYYAVVGGWVLHYTLLSLQNSFVSSSPQEVAAMFKALVGSPLLQIFWHGVFMLLTVLIVAGGVRKGIERGNKVMMPFLFLLLCVLLLYALQTEGAKAGLDFLLSPRWDQMSPAGGLAALGQAFFSLSLGMGAMITYGSYLGQETHLVRSAFYVVIGDTLVAVLAGFVIFPLVFTFHLKPEEGPGLIFQTLPIAFAQLPAGRFIAIAFFLLLTFAALTSAISLLEVVVAYFIDEKRWSRARASWVLGGIIFLCGIPSASGGQFLGLMDTLATNYLLPLGAILIALFTGWVLSHTEKLAEFQRGHLTTLCYPGWSILIRYVSPLAVALIFLHQLGIF
ncbi:MAG: sodium-dependent transporter [Deltaproteobacteria bacterium]|nr:sodium-dependent transporter [Deltaproteobacteria bacterium]